jgi:hypothetical protein
MYGSLAVHIYPGAGVRIQYIYNGFEYHRSVEAPGYVLLRCSEQRCRATLVITEPGLQVLLADDVLVHRHPRPILDGDRGSL